MIWTCSTRIYIHHHTAGSTTCFQFSGQAKMVLIYHSTQSMHTLPSDFFLFSLFYFVIFTFHHIAKPLSLKINADPLFLASKSERRYQIYRLGSFKVFPSKNSPSIRSRSSAEYRMYFCGFFPFSTRGLEHIKVMSKKDLLNLFWV